jgi:pyruvate dehydrogenase E1 component alpha subunit
VQNISARASGYGIPGKTADGMDVVEVYEAAGEYMENARSGKGPALLELKTWRYRQHFQGEPAMYRTKAEEQEWLRRDPLEIARKRFEKNDLLPWTKAKEIQDEVDGELAKAVEYGRTSPFPDPEEALADVYA